VAVPDLPARPAILARDEVAPAHRAGAAAAREPGRALPSGHVDGSAAVGWRGAAGSHPPNPDRGNPFGPSAQPAGPGRLLGMTEPLHAAGQGGQVSFDGQWLTIHRKGFLARATVGKGDKRIPVASVTAVQWKPAGVVVNGYIQFSLGGGSERRAQLGRQTVDAASDENSVVFTKKQQPAFEQVRDAVEAAIGARHAPAPEAASPASVADELGKLAALRDQGVLTAEEFEAAKRRLLGG
jgi:hypothetical protein